MDHWASRFHVLYEPLANLLFSNGLNQQPQTVAMPNVHAVRAHSCTQHTAVMKSHEAQGHAQSHKTLPKAIVGATVGKADLDWNECSFTDICACASLWASEQLARETAVQANGKSVVSKLLSD